MQLRFPSPVQTILKRMKDAGFEVYIVGGAVRDLILKKQTEDWDFATSATPEQIQKVFPDSFYDNTFGTVGIAGKHLSDTTAPEAVYEITTFRSEGVYTDHRRPDSVTWGKTIEEDLQRRDFTINAMALDDQQIVDPFDGRRDLGNKLIRAVGKAEVRFQEDALRMMRAVRFAAQLGFEIEKSTLTAIKKHAALIERISWERVRDEFLKILVSPHPDQGITMLDEAGILTRILPELQAAKGVEQAHHHIYDVWTHSLYAVRDCPSNDPIVRFAVLLHDIAKPKTAKKTADGVTFYNHEVAGARMARDIALRFKLSKKDVQRVFTLVRWHMFVYNSNVTDAYIRRFIRRVGPENLQDMIDLRTGDRLGSGAKRTSWRLEELQKRVKQQMKKTFTIHDMKVNGKDIMRELKMKPGPKVGEILKQLFAEVVENPSKNTKKYLVSKLQKLK